MAENANTGMDFPKQPPDIELLIARGRALRNRMICDACGKLLLRLKKLLGM